MSVKMVLLPVFVQVALTFAISFWMGASRTALIRNRVLQPGDIALGQPNWPAKTMQISNSYHNQLELPVLYYLIVVLALFTAKADLLFVIMSWLFVGSRILHAAVHTGSNRLSRRFFAFAFGLIVLLAMWMIFAIKLFAA